MSINIITVGGRLAADPTINEINPNTTVCNLTVVTEYNYKKPDGTYGKELCFADCTLWNRHAEMCALLKKGAMVTVTGRLKQEKWVNKDTGKSSSRFIIAADTILFMEPKPIETKDSFTESFDELPF